MNNKRKIGEKYELAAAEYLKQKGYAILERNYFCKKGEIDLITMENAYLVFVEVKYRSSLIYGFPEEAVDLKKQKKLYQAAEYYCYQNKISEEMPCRFDVVLISPDRIELIKDAFWGNSSSF